MLSNASSDFSQNYDFVNYSEFLNINQAFAESVMGDEDYYPFGSNYKNTVQTSNSIEIL